MVNVDLFAYLMNRGIISFLGIVLTHLYWTGFSLFAFSFLSHIKVS